MSLYRGYFAVNGVDWNGLIEDWLVTPQPARGRYGYYESHTGLVIRDMIEQDESPIGGYQYRFKVGFSGLAVNEYGLTTRKILPAITECTCKDGTYRYIIKSFRADVEVAVRMKTDPKYNTNYDKWNENGLGVLKAPRGQPGFGTYEGTIVHERAHGDPFIKLWKEKRPQIQNKINAIMEIKNTDKSCSEAKDEMEKYRTELWSLLNSVGREPEARQAEQNFYLRENGK